MVECGIGSGKTTMAAIIAALELFYCATDWNLRARFQMKPQTRVAFIFGSKDEHHSRMATFSEFLPFCSSPFFTDFFPPNYRREDFDPDSATQKSPKAVRFTGGYYVFPMTKNVLDLLSWNVRCAVLDEANYLEYVTNSKRAAETGVYDAAENFVDEAMPRIFSRWQTAGRTEGLCMLISNRRHSMSWMTKAIDKLQAGGQLSWPAMGLRLPTWVMMPKERRSENYIVLDTTTMEIVGEGTAGDGKYPEAEGYGVY
jgi:hypothetical protein